MKEIKKNQIEYTKKVKKKLDKAKKIRQESPATMKGGSPAKNVTCGGKKYKK